MGVVPYEIGPDAPMEALRAQAVAARSEAIMALESKLYSGLHHDLTSDVECQVYSGNHRRSAKTDSAVGETAAMILMEGDEPIHAFYASNCGGYSEAIQNVWPTRHISESYASGHLDALIRTPVNLQKSWHFRLWLKQSPDVLCNPRLDSLLPAWSVKNFRWRREFQRNELTQMLSKENDYGRFKRIKVLKRGDSGRIIDAELIFQKKVLRVTGELKLRMMFKPALRSSAFIVKRRWGKVVLEGAGWGHGVGMCQTGARALANQTYSFQDILIHYYPAAEIGPVYRIVSSAGSVPPED